MKNTRTTKATTVSSTIPVVTPKETTSCGCGCGCGQTNYGLLKTVIMAGSIWGSALIIAGSIIAADSFKTPTVSPLPAPAPRAVASETSMKAFIEANPQLILDTVNKHLEAQQRAAESQEPAEPQVAPQEIIDEIVNDKSNYSLGNPKGKFVIIEFFDHQCGWCKRTNAAMTEALKSPDAKNIRWIPIDTPIFGEKSEEIARYVLAAGKQGKYAEMHAAVAESKTFDEAAFVAMGKKIGLDTKKLVADANGEEIKAKLEANKKYARSLNINGVPMLIVNGKINPGALFGERLDAAVQESKNVK